MQMSAAVALDRAPFSGGEILGGYLGSRCLALASIPVIAAAVAMTPAPRITQCQLRCAGTG